ncbi:26452_t:CDS:2, partial [Racocetra persica]
MPTLTKLPSVEIQTAQRLPNNTFQQPIAPLSENNLNNLAKQLKTKDKNRQHLLVQSIGLNGSNSHKKYRMQTATEDNYNSDSST